MKEKERETFLIWYISVSGKENNSFNNLSLELLNAEMVCIMHGCALRRY